MSLHARVEDATPSSWEDPSLAQIWFRGADYIVPRDDVGIFTLGRLPRDPERCRALEEVADSVHRVLDGQTFRAREVYDALGGDHELAMFVRAAAVTGRYLIRWDASMIWIIPIDVPDIDPEEARISLARRFVCKHGPVTIDRFAWWAGIERDDANTTWRALVDELETVEFEGRLGLIHEQDVEALTGGEPVTGVRLVPSDDPYTKIDRDLLLTSESERLQVFPETSRGFIANALLVDGEIVGAWGRKQGSVTMYPFKRLNAATASALTDEAQRLPVKAKIDVRWET